MPGDSDMVGHMKATRKSVAAGLGGATLLGLGLYLAIPAAAADPSPSPGVTKSADPKGKDREGARDDKGRKGPNGNGGRWGAAIGRGLHGEATVQRKDRFHVRTWQRGEVTSVSPTNVTVRSADGTAWTWATHAGTTVRKNKEKAAVSSLAKGDRLFVFGERYGATRTAKMIRVPVRD
jgi:hypothetical protein